MPGDFTIDILNTERNVASGMHEPEGEMLWSVPNDAAMADDKLSGGLADNKSPSDFDSSSLAKGLKVELEHTNDKGLAREIAMDHLTEDSKYYDKLELIEARLVNAFKKEAIGLLDIPTSMGIRDEPDEQGEVLTFKGTPQNPGLSREMGDDEETDFFGSAEESISLPPRNKKYKNDGEVMINELDRLEKHLIGSGKVNEARAIMYLRKKATSEEGGVDTATGLAASIFNGLGIIPAPIMAILGSGAGSAIKDYFFNTPEAKSALDRQKDIVSALGRQLSEWDVSSEMLGKLSNHSIAPNALPTILMGDPNWNPSWWRGKIGSLEPVRKLAVQYVQACDKLTQIFKDSLKKVDSVTTSEPTRAPLARPATAIGERGLITRPGDPYTYSSNPNGPGYVVVSGPGGKGVGNVLYPGTKSHDLVQAADPAAQEVAETTVEEATEDPKKAEGKRLYKEALEAAGRGEHDVAATLFRQSYDAYPLHTTLFNIGKALYNSQDKPAALEAFERLRDEYPEEFAKYIDGTENEAIPTDIVQQLSQISEEGRTGSVRRIVLNRDKQERLQRYYTEQFGEEGTAKYEELIAKLKSGNMQVQESSEQPGGRKIALVDFGNDLPGDLRYDGVYFDTKRNAWVAGGLKRREVRALNLERGSVQKKELRRERRQDRRDTRSDRRQDKRRDRLRRRERARREARQMAIEELYKTSKSS